MDIAGAIAAFSAKNPAARVSAKEEKDGLSVGVTGSLELQVSYELQNLLALIVERMEPGRRLAIDLGEVSYISSTGVGALTNTLVAAHKRNIEVVFRRVPPKVSSILELLGLSSFFAMEEEDA